MKNPSTSIEEDQGVHFIAMELVDGKVFSELIPRDGFSATRLLQYAIPVADAVAAGIVALLLLAVGYLVLRGAPEPITTALQIRRLTNTGDSSAAAISPDGKRVVHVVDSAGHSIG